MRPNFRTSTVVTFVTSQPRFLRNQCGNDESAASDVKLRAGAEAMVPFGFAVVRSMAANVRMAVPPTRYNGTPEVLTTSRNRGNWGSITSSYCVQRG